MEERIYEIQEIYQASTRHTVELELGWGKWTLSPRGASVGIGKRGTFLNTGIPGTRLSSRRSFSGGIEMIMQVN